MKSLKENDLKNKSITPQDICQERNNHQEVNEAILHAFARMHTNIQNLSVKQKNINLSAATDSFQNLVSALGASTPLQTFIATQMLSIADLNERLLPIAKASVGRPDQMQYYVNSLTKLSNVFIQQAILLQKLQNGNVQKMIVEHVHVSSGGKAIIGNIYKTEGACNGKSK